MFKIYGGRKEFYQWDIDTKVIVNDPFIDEVHFCNRTGDCSLIEEVYEYNGVRVANVPRVLLEDSWAIKVYAYRCGCYTETSATFKVVARTKPANFIEDSVECIDGTGAEVVGDTLVLGDTATVSGDTIYLTGSTAYNVLYL